VEPLANGRSVTDGGGFPVLRLNCLANGVVDLTKFKTGNWTEDEASKYVVKPGDFLIARGNGTLSLVGRGGLVAEHDHPVAYPDTLIRVRLRPDVILPRLFALFWNSPPMRRQLEPQARTTSGLYKVNQSILANCIIPIPPHDEQEELLSFADRLLQTCDSVASTLMLRETTATRLLESFTYHLTASPEASRPAAFTTNKEAASPTQMVLSI
jgi:type I restriction enzyme S subunit